MSLNIALSQAPTVPLAVHQKLEQDFEELLNAYDAAVRACHNSKISDTYFRLLFSFFETYPQALQTLDQQFEIDVKLIREGAGADSDKKKSNATRFFQDMAAAGAWDYEARYDKALGKRRSLLTPRQALVYTEDLDPNSVARKRRKREEEEKQKNQFKDPRKLWHCEECGGELLYDATPHCKVCGHVHATIKDIPASEITIEAEIIEVADDFESWLNEETEHRQAVKPGVKIVQTPLPAAPSGKIGKHPRGIPCPDCGARESWTPMQTEWGGEVFYCTVCYPSMAAD